VSVVGAGRKHAKHQMPQKEVQPSEVLRSLQDSAGEERQSQELIFNASKIIVITVYYGILSLV
jgi:hypothetical protein